MRDYIHSHPNLSDREFRDATGYHATTIGLVKRFETYGEYRTYNYKRKSIYPDYAKVKRQTAKDLAASQSDTTSLPQPEIEISLAPTLDTELAGLDILINDLKAQIGKVIEAAVVEKTKSVLEENRKELEELRELKEVATKSNWIENIKRGLHA